jgi:NADPH:quinone reductase-like Zn-dependent oxidoreductase
MSKEQEVVEEEPRRENFSGKMSAIRVHQYGKSDVLQFEEVSIPSIRPDEVLVKVHAAGVNPVDWKIREGRYKPEERHLPFTPGLDVAGTVEETGSLISAFKKGDAVFGRPSLSRDGAYAEYVAVPGFELAIAPSRISMQEAAGVPTVAQTAWAGLFEYGRLDRDHSLLIHGGSGGVGSFAIQLAKMAGAYVIATTSSENINFVRSLGADVVIDYESEDFTQRIKKVDMVFDTIGGETQERSYRVLHRGGRLISTVGVKEGEAEKYEVTAKGFIMLSNGSRLGEIAKLLEKRMLKVTVEKEFLLSDARAAQDLSQTGRARGKIILRVS